MKHNKLILTVVAVFLSLSSFAQTGRITANFSNVPLSKAIEVIEGASSYTFFYDSAKIDLAARVSLDAADLSVDEAIGQMLSSLDLGFEVKGDQIVLMPVSAQTPQVPSTLTLTILDRSNLPVIGAAFCCAVGLNDV